MAIATVYAPASGQITARENYCGVPCDNNPCTGDHGLHNSCSYSSPVDIAALGDVKLYVNYPTVKSIRTLIGYTCCCDEQNAYSRSVTVQLYSDYNGTGCYIGAVLYGHVNAAVGHNQLYNLTSSEKKVATTISGTYSCGGVNCYQGIHMHMERSGGVTIAPCCCSNANAGTTAIYRWSFTPPCGTQPGE